MTTGTNQTEQPIRIPEHVHGTNGVWYGGEWLDIEDCDGTFTNLTNSSTKNCSTCDHKDVCVRSKSKLCVAKNVTPSSVHGQDQSTKDNNNNNKEEEKVQEHYIYDIVIIGAGCIGAAIARELAKYQHTNQKKLSVLILDAADDVSQGATKGNSGIVHAGYDDKPGTNRAKYCWKGNQMFSQLDKELRFGYQKNGSLVIAMNGENEINDRKELQTLLERGKINGVQNLRIVERDELFQMEPYLSKNAVAALYSPDAGNVIPYEYTIALLENAIDNGIELHLRSIVTKIEQKTSKETKNESNFILTVQEWEPKDFVESSPTVSGNTKKSNDTVLTSILLQIGILGSVIGIIGYQYLIVMNQYGDIMKRQGFTISVFDMLQTVHNQIIIAFGLVAYGCVWVWQFMNTNSNTKSLITKTTPFQSIVEMANMPLGSTNENPTVTVAATQSNNKNNTNNVTVNEMLVGGSGSKTQMNGQIIKTITIECRNVINCAGGYSDKIANMINDYSFTIQPRIGDYLLLSKKQGYLAHRTLFPCPDPKLGKGVLVQTTLWGNLILGPTARDMHDPTAAQMTTDDIQQYILSLCKRLVPTIDAGKTFHSFAGARAKSSRGDWIIEPSQQNQHFLHVAGIDSPGLAGSPAIALEVIEMLKRDGLKFESNPNFIKDREAIILPKQGMTGLKIGPVGKYDTDGIDEKLMSQNVICKCEKVTELEIVRAIRRSIPIDSSQGIRKRTRAGMGSCQGKYDNYNCENRVRAIIARETSSQNIKMIGQRPWPATSTLHQRWLDDNHREQLVSLMNQ
jgi:L-2-hydroxyglutarate oxidase LhgO/bacterioferritin-associated ferredoxin